MPEGNANVFQDDLGLAAVALVEARAERFPMIDRDVDNELRIEYGRQATAFTSGAKGRCLVRPLAVQPVEGQSFEESGLSDFQMNLDFEFKDVKDKLSLFSIVSQAVISTFGDRGKAMLALLVDTGSNRLKKSGLVRILQIIEDEAYSRVFGVDNCRVVTTLSIQAWHPVPMNHPPAPQLSIAVPASGPAAGGTAVRLDGQYLTGATGVTFGGTPATGVVVRSQSRIDCVAPAHAAGPVSVVATTPSGQNSPNALYTYA